MSSPVGSVIGGNKASNQWRIGKEIGSGACASVHLLVGPDGKQSDFVVKVTPLPTKITKQKKTIPERNARLLYHEGLLYQNTFPEYLGFVLPELPRSSNGPPITGDIDGFRFLAMEKMEAPLFDVVPLLLKAGSDSINLGVILQQLLICVESFHDEDHLLVDIKAENFMFANQAHNRSNLKRKRKKSTEEELAEKIRALDIALSTRWKGMHGSHRPDEGICEIIGTPLYCSRHLHDKHTPSRRDDLEALLIVAAELIIRIVAEANGQARKFEGSGKNKIPTYLPWSTQKSDDAIGARKAQELKDPKSSFYKRMGDAEVAKQMHSLFEMTASMKYKEKPEYKAFHNILSSLKVKVEPPKKKAATKPVRSSRATRSKRAASPAEIVEVDDSPSPKKQSKTTKDNQDGFFDAEMEVEDEAEEFVDANEVEEMDWELVKENRANPATALGVTIAVTEGPHKGEHFDLSKGGTETIIVGKKPQSNKAIGAEALWVLSSDADANDIHAKLELKASKKLCSVKVQDMKSDGGVLVGSKKLTRGKEAQCFINDKFQVGQTVFCIKGLSRPEGEEAIKKPKAAKSKTPAKKKPLAQKNEPAAAVDSNTAADVRLKVVKGPHKGESFALILSESEIFNLGSTESSAKKGEPIVLASDPSIEKRHARFQLRGSKRMLSVAVTDLSESGTLEVNGKQIVKGKEHIAFMNDKVQVGDNTTLEIVRG